MALSEMQARRRPWTRSSGFDARPAATASASASRPRHARCAVAARGCTNDRGRSRSRSGTRAAREREPSGKPLAQTPEPISFRRRDENRHPCRESIPADRRARSRVPQRATRSPSRKSTEQVKHHPGDW